MARCGRCGDEDLLLDARGYCYRIEDCLIRLDQRVSAFARRWWAAAEIADQDDQRTALMNVGEQFAGWVDRRVE